MSELSYVLLTPHTVEKGRIGAVMTRLLSRTNLELLAAQMVSLDSDMTEKYAALLMKNNDCSKIHDLAVSIFSSGKHAMLLVLKGDNAVQQVAEVCGAFPAKFDNGAVTIRDSYSEFVTDDSGNVIYAEPCLFVPQTREAAESELRLLAEYAAAQKNVLFSSADTERTLVILKPENWRRPCIRPGAVIDIFTRTGLKLAGCKMHRISVASALNFYGPVQDALRSKLGPKLGAKGAALLEKEFGLVMQDDSKNAITEVFGNAFADDQFYQIVQFMSGDDPLTAKDKSKPGQAKCMVLVFEGKDAVSKIRTVLGPTDPSKADGGTVRGEFGTNIMVNAAHASDSPESYVRESGILETEVNKLSELVLAELN